MTVRELAQRDRDAAFEKEREEMDGPALGQDDELVSRRQRLDGLERADERLGRGKTP
jgi:hypothetical protein